MQTLFALVLAAAAAAIVIARPPGPIATTVSHDDSAPHSPTRKYLNDYLLPQYLWPHYFAYDENKRLLEPHRRLSMPATDWLNKEIARLSRLHQRSANPFKSDIKFPNEPPLMKRMLALSPYNMRSRTQPDFSHQPWLATNMVAEQAIQQQTHENNEIVKPANLFASEPISIEDKKKMFALTPAEEGYFETTEKDSSSANSMSEGLHEGGDQQGLHEEGVQLATDAELLPEPRRQIRQNPNHSRTKTLIAEDIEKLQKGLGHEKPGPTGKSQNIHVEETPSTNDTGSFYDVALISAIGAAVVMAFLGFAFAWYTLSKRAKAAADVDYPAYGVTGPTMDCSGDRKLAHSAHMYHYQHQKQQIIAMERSGMDERNGSVSDPESDDENEEGDYTVYECPGFATTGDMEVKNPLFNEEPTPATPGKCEVVKPQPKD